MKLNKKAQADGLAWFFAIIVVIVILVLFYLGTVVLSHYKKVNSQNLGVDERNFERLNSLWALESFLFFKENEISREIIYNFIKLQGTSLAPLGTSPIVNLGIESNKEFMIKSFTEYVMLYGNEGLYCYMLIINNYYNGKNCIDQKLNSNNFFQFDKKSLNQSYYDLNIYKQNIGVKIIEEKNE